MGDNFRAFLGDLLPLLIMAKEGRPAEDVAQQTLSVLERHLPGNKSEQLKLFKSIWEGGFGHRVKEQCEKGAERRAPFFRGRAAYWRQVLPQVEQFALQVERTVISALTSGALQEIANHVFAGLESVVCSELLRNVEASDSVVGEASTAWLQQYIPGEGPIAQSLRQEFPPAKVQKLVSLRAQALRRQAVIIAALCVDEGTSPESPTIKKIALGNLESFVRGDPDRAEMVVATVGRMAEKRFIPLCRNSGLLPAKWVEQMEAELPSMVG